MAREGKRSRYSRSPPPPAELRIRVLGAAPIIYGTGKAFVRFAVDERWSRDADAEWNTEATASCVYPGDGAVYVDVGEAFRTGEDVFTRGAFGDGDGVAGGCPAASTGAAAPAPTG